MKEAKEIVKERAGVLEREEVSLQEAYGRVTGEDLILQDPIPPHPISLMDGYALCSKDTISPPSKLSIIGKITAGESPREALKREEAMNIMTGAPLPEGANAVEREERVKREDSTILLYHEVKEGQYTLLRGEDLKGGEKVLKRGERIHALAYHLLSTLRKENILVYRRPEVAILTTGNELVEVGGKGSLHLQPNSNAYLLAGLVQEAGGLPSLLGIARDDREDLVESMKRGLSYDLLITTGGLGRGVHDVMERAWERLKIATLIREINARPGRRLLFGLYEKRPVFSLPGSPGAVLVLFLELIRPLLKIMQGEEVKGYGTGTLTRVVTNHKAENHYQMGRLKESEGLLLIDPILGSSFLLSSTESSILFIIPSNQEYREGDRVEYIEI